MHRDVYKIADAVYDMFILLDALSSSLYPKKIMNELYSSTLKFRKTFSKKQFVDFFIFWRRVLPILSQWEYWFLSKYMVYIFMIVYENPFNNISNQRGATIDKDGSFQQQGDTLSGMLLHIASASIADQVFMFDMRYLKETGEISSEFEEWCHNYLESPPKEYSLAVIKHFAIEYKCKSYLDLFGRHNQLKELGKEQMPILVNRYVGKFSDAADPVMETMKWIDSLLKTPLWSCDSVRLQLQLIHKEVTKCSVFIINKSWINAIVKMYSPDVNLGSLWNDFEVTNELRYLEGTYLSEFVEKYLPKDILMRRQFYIREGGIYLELSGPIHGVSKIFIEEIHSQDNHYIWMSVDMVTDSLKINTKDYVFPIENIAQGIILFYCELDLLVLYFLLYWLGVVEEWQSSFPEVFSEKDVEVYIEMIQVYAFISDIYPKQNISYTSNSKPQKTSKSYTGAYTVEHKQIGNFIRRLPIGYVASEEAKSRARQYLIELPPGHTFVRNFTREQKVLFDKEKELK